MRCLRHLFLNHIISRHGDIQWPARSPDLTSCDFFFWEYLKMKVFNRPPLQDIEQLKERIRLEVSWIPAQMLRCVMGYL